MSSAPSLSVSSKAHTTIVNHALSHPTSIIHGALIGNRSSTGGVDITDVAPISHSHLTSLLIEGGITSAEGVWCKGNGSMVVGWYVCNERFSDLTPPESVMKVMEKIEAINGKELGSSSTVLIVVNAKKLLAPGGSNQPLQCYGKGTMGKHVKAVESNDLFVGPVTRGGRVDDIAKVFDFEDQMEEVIGADWRNNGPN